MLVIAPSSRRSHGGRLLGTKSLSLVTAAIGTLCVWSGAAFAQTQPKLSMPSVKVAMAPPEAVQNAALHAALRGGDFEREGLKVEIVQFRSWTEPVQAIASDSAQFALGAASLIRAVKGQNAPVRQIAMISSRFPYDFWARKGGPASLQDLKGKTIQTVRTGETLDNIWKQVLSSAGLAIGDVKRIEGFNGLGALASGSADAANVVDTLLGKSRAAGLTPLLDYTRWREDKGLSRGAGANLGWGASSKFLRDNPDSAKAFLRALTRATERLRKDRAFALTVLTDKPFEIEPDVAGEIYDRHKDHWIMRMDIARGDAAFDAEMVEVVMELPPGSIPVASFVDARPMTEVLGELGITY